MYKIRVTEKNRDYVDYILNGLKKKPGKSKRDVYPFMEFNDEGFLYYTANTCDVFDSWKCEEVTITEMLYRSLGVRINIEALELIAGSIHCRDCRVLGCKVDVCEKNNRKTVKDCALKLLDFLINGSEKSINNKERECKPLAPDWIKPGLVMGKDTQNGIWHMHILSHIVNGNGEFLFYGSYDIFDHVAPIDNAYLGMDKQHPDQITANELLEKYDCSKLPVVER